MKNRALYELKMEERLRPPGSKKIRGKRRRRASGRHFIGFSNELTAQFVASFQPLVLAAQKAIAAFARLKDEPSLQLLFKDSGVCP